MKEILEFNHKKQCGLWLILIGIVLIVAVICGGEFFVNPFVFLIGYYACFFGVNVNKKVREKLSQGDISKKQIKMIVIYWRGLYQISISSFSGISNREETLFSNPSST